MSENTLTPSNPSTSAFSWDDPVTDDALAGPVADAMDGYSEPAKEIQMTGTEVTNKTLNFKRYANRKLYSLDQSRYVTTRELGDLVRQGRQVQVVDQGGKDITGIVLGSVIAQMQEKTETAAPTSMLASLIRGGTVAGTDAVVRGSLG